MLKLHKPKTLWQFQCTSWVLVLQTVSTLHHQLTCKQSLTFDVDGQFQFGSCQNGPCYTGCSSHVCPHLVHVCWWLDWDAPSVHKASKCSLCHWHDFCQQRRCILCQHSHQLLIMPLACQQRRCIFCQHNQEVLGILSVSDAVSVDTVITSWFVMLIILQAY